MSKKNPTPAEQEAQALEERRNSIIWKELGVRDIKADYEKMHYFLESRKLREEYNAALDDEKRLYTEYLETLKDESVGLALGKTDDFGNSETMVDSATAMSDEATNNIETGGEV